MENLKESQIEKYLVRRVKEMGGRAYKWISPGNNGVPDRIVCLEGGRVCFVELKRPGGTPRPLQTQQLCTLQKMGFTAQVVDSFEAADRVLAEVMRT